MNDGKTVAVALAYVAYLGAHWLPLGLSDQELSASASRVWDIKQQITQHHALPWWTPWFMSGSSYGLNHARGFYLIPWILFSTVTDLMTAGKLTALLAILAGAVAMLRYLQSIPDDVLAANLTVDCDEAGTGADALVSSLLAALAPACRFCLEPLPGKAVQS